MTFLQRHRFRLFLLCVFVITWCWAAWKPLHPDDWLLENYLVFIWVPILLLTGRYLRLSDLSYTLITVFMCLHVIGSHYTYAEVPFGETLKGWLDADRNMYDRLVHFCYGLLLAYPVREVLVRVARLKGFWGYFFPVDLTFAFSSIYEIIEWQAAVVVNPDLGLAFLGSQGDIWDAQKDMVLAGSGAIIAMLLAFLVSLWLNPDTMQEMRASLTVPRQDRPLGETRIREWLGKKSR